MEEQVLDYIIRYKCIMSYSPTEKEIGEGVNSKSKHHVHYALEALAEKGYIEMKPKQPRTIKILKVWTD